MRRGALLLLAAALAAGRLVAQEAGDTSSPRSPRLEVLISRDSTGTLRVPVVQARDLLSDGVFVGALHNGFAVQFSYRLSLWRSVRIFDRLVREATWDVVIVQNPVDNTYELLQPAGVVQTFRDARRLEAALNATRYDVPLLPPPSSGDRYYYVASLDVESLTANELDDVQRWLRGDVERAITGRGDVGNALTRGARMLLIKWSGLPHRSFEARTDPFRP